MDQKLDVKKYVRELGAAARAAARELARAGTLAKNRALAAMAKEIRDGSSSILAANADDLRQAKRNKADAAFLDRLALTAELIEQMAAGVEAVAALADPVDGLFAQRRMRIGQSFYTSQIVAACLSVPGVVTVDAIHVHAPISAGKDPYRPGPGSFFRLAGKAHVY